MLTRSTFLAYFSCTVAFLGLSFQSFGAEELPALTVLGQETANQRPVTTFETPLSNLDFDPRVDFQSRNMAEAQGDISIRGGTFENTGIQLGSATMLDSQTGHFTTELPIAPEMLGTPKVLTGTDNALRGFNSSVGTISYSWSEINKGGSLTLGGGDHNLNFQRIHHALTGNYENSKDWTWGAEIEGSRSESDGTISFGDHAFDRTSGRIQLLGPDSQTDLFVGYQDKFYGWPGMYTANPADNHETEDYQIELFLLNHTQQYEAGFFEFTGFHRTIADEFHLQREVPGYYKANHKNLVHGFGLSGKHELNNNFSINHSAQVTFDNIKSSKVIFNNAEEDWDLKQGSFTERQYYKVSLLPEYNYTLSDDEVITYKGGISWDDSNRDKQRFSPIAEISWTRTENEKNSENIYLSYSESTQVLGYGAIGGPTNSGTFQSTRDLRRSVSKNLELGYTINRDKWKLNTSIFHRRDDDLVDWTYDLNWTKYRKANHADIDTLGFEIIASRHWEKFQAICSYTHLDKEENYQNANVIGSFYALNYPKHRATLGLIWDPNDVLQIRIDNEWRKQRDNAIRQFYDGKPNKSFLSHFAASYFPPQFDELEIFLAYDKPWEKDFQDIPGIAPRGDQFSFGATYSW